MPAPKVSPTTAGLLRSLHGALSAIALDTQERKANGEFGSGGSGSSASSSKSKATQIAAKLGGRESHVSESGESVGFSTKKTHAEASKDLASAGFKKDSSSSGGGEVGRAKVGGGSVKTNEKTTKFTHPDGSTATVRTVQVSGEAPRSYINVQVKKD